LNGAWSFDIKFKRQYILKCVGFDFNPNLGFSQNQLFRFNVMHHHHEICFISRSLWLLSMFLKLYWFRIAHLIYQISVQRFWSEFHTNWLFLYELRFFWKNSVADPHHAEITKEVIITVKVHWNFVSKLKIKWGILYLNLVSKLIPFYAYVY
jgi:hypothetical protein